MNEKAEELGLESTSYADPSGLLNANVSSAYDMARLISYVSGNDAHLEHHAEAGVHGVDGPPQHHGVVHQSAREAGDVDVQAGKTGFIRKAGYCLATLLRLPQGGPRSRWSCSARSRTRAASGKRATCSTGWRARPRTCSAAPVEAASQN